MCYCVNCRIFQRAIVPFYAISKAAVHHFTKCLALEMAPHGVRVNAVAHMPFLKSERKRRLRPVEDANEQQSDRMVAGEAGRLHKRSLLEQNHT